MQSWLVSLFLDCPIGMDLHCPGKAEVEVSCATTSSVSVALLPSAFKQRDSKALQWHKSLSSGSCQQLLGHLISVVTLHLPMCHTHMLPHCHPILSQVLSMYHHRTDVGHTISDTLPEGTLPPACSTHDCLRTLDTVGTYFTTCSPDRKCSTVMVAHTC